MMISNLFNRLDRSTCSFLAADTIINVLKNNKFVQLKPEEDWEIKPGGKYYLEKNSSAVFAIVLGEKNDKGYKIISAHTDSPCFKLKPNPEIIGDGGVITLNVEKYGGGILYTWFDRPLSMSGRLLLKDKDPLHPREVLFDLEKPVATIPHLAIHFNREVNEGNRLSVQKDMKPVLGYFSDEEIMDSIPYGGMVRKMICDNLGISPELILDMEVILYPCFKATKVGYSENLYQSGRIDDLSMAFAGLEALTGTCDVPSDSIRVLAVFDNEETGSATKQGAASPVLANILSRIERALGRNEDSHLKNIEKGFMISADCAHAWHPNYSERHDPTNHPVIGGGPVIKINANGKYMTDAYGSAVFQNICKEAGVEYQFFVNHSDIAGGSTLGNISTSQMDLKGVDVGAAMWAMHSAVETAGISDYIDFVKVFKKFWTL